MSYTLTGSFIEACDCFIVCPCWVDEDADDGHCTGLVAWSLDAMRRSRKSQFTFDGSAAPGFCLPPRTGACAFSP